MLQFNKGVSGMSYKSVAAFVLIILLNSLSAFSQIPNSNSHISIPPEFKGIPKTTPELSRTERQFLEISAALYDQNSAATKLPELEEFIKVNPNYAGAYSLRAQIGVCELKTLGYESAVKDLSKAISLGPSKKSQVDNYSFRAWLEFTLGKYKNSIDDLETAIKLDVDHADNIFNSGGIKPQRISPPCKWNLSELDKLIAQFPRDYRPSLYRGLYFEFFSTFDKSGYSSNKSLEDFRRAASLSPKSPFPPYYIGGSIISAGFMHNSTWSSESLRNTIYRKALLSYTTAITLDPGFAAA
jgi:tetratricopeptide (TPR) repeat protein